MENFLNGLQRLWQNKMMKVFMLTFIVIIITIIIIIILVSNGNKDINETNLVNATKKYLRENSSMLPDNNYDMTRIDLSTLVSSGYLNSKSNGSTCNSYVNVAKIDSNYVYTPYINCGNESDTILLKSKLLGDVTTNGDGLYINNNTYIYRGENPNNNVLFGETQWRVIGLDEFNNVKMIYDGPSADYDSWDDRYNSITDDQDGINDYSLSRAKEYLDSYINNYPEIFKSEHKTKITKHTACIASVNMNSNQVNSCSSTLNNILVSLITVNDYMNASLDTTCNISNTKNCQNYNFLNKNGWTITASNTDNVSVYYINENEGIMSTKAYAAKAFRPVIVLRNDIIYVSGDGSSTNPYIIR